jgi:hypothetical protein
MIKHCEWCDNKFTQKVKYQIYCSADCRQLATKEKIAQRYIQERTKRRSLIKRFCKSCGHLLSMYNETQLCESCDVNPKDVSKALKDIRKLIDGESE